MISSFKKLYGVTTAMVTPFDQDDNVNYSAVKELTEFLISKGVHGLYPMGTTGEMIHLSVEERKEVAKTVLEQADGRAVVYIQVGGVKLKETIELAKHAHDIGADGIGVVTPIYFKHSDRELEEFYFTVANAVPADFPVYAYSIPQLSSNELKPELLQKIADRCPNLVGVKYSFPNMAVTDDYLRINNGTFSVLQGADLLFLPVLAMGCDGSVSGTSCVFPEAFVAVYEAFKEGNIKKARDLQLIATKCNKITKNGNMAYYKEVLKMRGIPIGYMRRPFMDLTGQEAAELREQVKSLGIL